MTFDVAFTTAMRLREAIASRQVSPVEVMQATIARVEKLEPRLNCFVTFTPELALAAAKKAEQELMSGQRVGPLHGLPLSVKDLIAVKDLKWTFGSRTMATNIASVDAPAVRRARAAGACILGKTTTSEFGCKAVGDSPLTGITRNPWDPQKTPGGSSSGAAASVAAGITSLALATDGGGSIRIPSSLTGTFGIKAQFGRVPVYPVAATPTLAHVGPIARTVRDAALLLSVIGGHDRSDPFAVAGPVPDFVAACDRPISGMRVAWSRTLGYATPDREIAEIAESAAKVFVDLGCEVVEVERVFDDDPIALWVSEAYTGVAARLERALREQPELLDPAVAEVLREALAQSSEEYYTNVFRRYELRDKVRLFFEDFDLLLTPTLPCAAFGVGLDVPPHLAQRNIVSWVYYTYPFNLTGQPAASIPAGLTRAGLPVGLQLVAKINHETDIFRAAAAFEAARPWAQDTPRGLAGLA